MKAIFEYLSTKVAKPIIKQDIIYATDKTIKQIVKSELDRLGHDADLNHIDVSEVTNFSELFCCDSASRINANLNSKYKDINPDISEWDVSNALYINSMFMDCNKFNCDISRWDISKCENMARMFKACYKFDCNISKWNVSNVKTMSSMFEYCEKFNQDISRWDVSNVKNMEYMFNGCTNFNKDISNWNINKVKYTTHMFNNCPIKEEFKPHFTN